MAAMHGTSLPASTLGRLMALRCAHGSSGPASGGPASLGLGSLKRRPSAVAFASSRSRERVPRVPLNLRMKLSSADDESRPSCPPASAAGAAGSASFSASSRPPFGVTAAAAVPKEGVVRVEAVIELEVVVGVEGAEALLTAATTARARGETVVQDCVPCVLETGTSRAWIHPIHLVSST